MRIIITGGSGFIGTALASSLAADNHEVIVLTRNPDKAGRLPPEEADIVSESVAQLVKSPASNTRHAHRDIFMAGYSAAVESHPPAHAARTLTLIRPPGPSVPRDSLAVRWQQRSIKAAGSPAASSHSTIS